jgi:RNA recognition motif-containing protein
LLLQKHFSFIQYEEVQPALDAIENENGQVFNGKILGEFDNVNIIQNTMKPLYNEPQKSKTLTL